MVLNYLTASTLYVLTSLATADTLWIYQQILYREAIQLKPTIHNITKEQLK